MTESPILTVEERFPTGGTGGLGGLVQIRAWIQLFVSLATHDPTVFDRWVWLRRRLTGGPLATFDAGCGSGAFSLYAGIRGNNCLGLSLENRQLSLADARAKRGNLPKVRFLCGDLRSLATMGEQIQEFDQIICCETLEHIVDDRKLVSEFARVLNRGGRLLLTVPYFGHHPLMVENPDKTFRLAVEDGGHVRYGYEIEEIREIFDAAGLDLVEEAYVGGLISQKKFDLWCLLNRYFREEVSSLVLAPLFFLRLVDPWLTRISGYPYNTLACIGVKR